MRELHAKELGLLYNNSVSISANNYTFWPDFDMDTDFPDKGELQMAVIPAVIPYGSGTEVPHLIKDLITFINGSPSALNSRSIAGIADAWKALQKSKFNSFYGNDNNYSANKSIFHKRNFANKLAKASVLPSMIIKETHCLRDSPNGNSIATTSMQNLPVN